jgi:hypothetical protein
MSSPSSSSAFVDDYKSDDDDESFCQDYDADDTNNAKDAPAAAVLAVMPSSSKVTVNQRKLNLKDFPDAFILPSNNKAISKAVHSNYKDFLSDTTAAFNHNTISAKNLYTAYHELGREANGKLSTLGAYCKEQAKELKKAQGRIRTLADDLAKAKVKFDAEKKKRKATDDLAMVEKATAKQGKKESTNLKNKVQSLNEELHKRQLLLITTKSENTTAIHKIKDLENQLKNTNKQQALQNQSELMVQKSALAVQATEARAQIKINADLHKKKAQTEQKQASINQLMNPLGGAPGNESFSFTNLVRLHSFFHILSCKLCASTWHAVPPSHLSCRRAIPQSRVIMPYQHVARRAVPAHCSSCRTSTLLVVPYQHVARRAVPPSRSSCCTTKSLVVPSCRTTESLVMLPYQHVVVPYRRVVVLYQVVMLYCQVVMPY